MERERLTRILEQPGNVAREDLVGLKAMTERYPWFSGAQMLLAVGEHEAGDVLFDGTLETSSTHIPNREVLFDLLEADGSSQQEEVSSIEIPSTIDGVLDAALRREGQEPEAAELVTELDEASSATAEFIEPMPKPREEDLLDRQIGEAVIASTYDLTRSKNVASLGKPRETVEPPLPATDLVAEAISAEIEVDTPLVILAPTNVSPVPPEQQKENKPQGHSKRSFTDWLTEDVSGTSEGLAVQAAMPEAAAPAHSTSDADHTTKEYGHTPTSNAALTPGTSASVPTPVTSEQALVQTGVDMAQTSGHPDQKELLDRFIQQDNPSLPKKTEFFTPQQAAKRSLDDSSGLVSETLAKIYVAQGNIAKGIDAYRRLGLKHPEKSAYFAALQKELEAQSNK